MPSPVPNSTAAPSTWMSLRASVMSVIARRANLRSAGQSQYHEIQTAARRRRAVVMPLVRAAQRKARPADAIEHHALAAHAHLVGDRTAQPNHATGEPRLWIGAADVEHRP